MLGDSAAGVVGALFYDTDDIETQRRRGMGRGCPLPSCLVVWGSIVRSPSCVRGGAMAEIDFGAF